MLSKMLIKHQALQSLYKSGLRKGVGYKHSEINFNFPTDFSPLSLVRILAPHGAYVRQAKFCFRMWKIWNIIT